MAPNSSTRPSRVHFPEHLTEEQSNDGLGHGSNPFRHREDDRAALPRSRFLSATGATSDWHFPGDQTLTPPPATYRERIASSNDETMSDARRTSDGSTSTLVENISSPNTPATPRQSHRSSLSTYNHPYDIQSPGAVYSPYANSPRNNADFERTPKKLWQDEEQDVCHHEDTERPFDSTHQLSRRRHGYLSNLIDLYNAAGKESGNVYETTRRDAILEATRRTSRLIDPLAYDPEWELLDRDDPLITGIRKQHKDDIDDIEKNARGQMTYKERQKERQRIRIEFNICCK